MKIYLLIFMSAIMLSSCNQKPIDNSAKDSANARVDRSDTEEPAEIVPFIERYKSNNIKTKGNNQNGKKVGHWTSYYEDGKLWSETDYIKGERNGVHKTYFPDGMLRYRGSYVNDLKQGKWYFYDEDGKVLKTLQYHRGEEVEKK